MAQQEGMGPLMAVSLAEMIHRRRASEEEVRAPERTERDQVERRQEGPAPGGRRVDQEEGPRPEGTPVQLQALVAAAALEEPQPDLAAVEPGAEAQGALP